MVCRQALQTRRLQMTGRNQMDGAPRFLRSSWRSWLERHGWMQISGRLVAQPKAVLALQIPLLLLLPPPLLLLLLLPLLLLLLRRPLPSCCCWLLFFDHSSCWDCVVVGFGLQHLEFSLFFCGVAFVEIVKSFSTTLLGGTWVVRNRVTSHGNSRTARYSPLAPFEIWSHASQCT